jgi:hypothetical protein
MRQYGILVMAVLLCAACGRQAPDPIATAPAQVVQPVVHPPVAPVKIATPEEWKQSLEGLYQISSVHDKGNGVSDFFANFGKSDGSAVYAFGSRDAFRKLRFYTPGIQSTLNVLPYVNTYISVPDNKMPNFFLAPYFFGKNGWLFMSHVAVMVDGELVIDRDFKDAKVERHADTYGVEERYNFIANQQELDGLKKISKTSKVIVRLTGSKGYITVQPKLANEFRDEIISAMVIYERMTATLAGHLPPE